MFPVSAHIYFGRTTKVEKGEEGGKVFTRDELALYNGQGGMPAYVACGGKVYDVSASYLWEGGEHQLSHNAGADLTEEILDAPHGMEGLERLPIVGIYQD